MTRGDRMYSVSWCTCGPSTRRAALKRTGCQKICTDKTTSASVNRPGLTKCLKGFFGIRVIWCHRAIRPEKQSFMTRPECQRQALILQAQTLSVTDTLFDHSPLGVT